MRVIPAKVVDGKVPVPKDLEEGTAVMILARDSSGYRLSAREEAEMSEALAQVRSGNYIEAGDLLAELKGSAS